MKTIAAAGMGIVLILLVCSSGAAQPEAEKPPADRQTLYRQFEQMLSGVKLVGRFTTLGREDQAPARAQYTITKVTKLEQGDFWLLATRIQYGQQDYTVPLPIEVKWAGDTPMIMLTGAEILGKGPYSARVIFYNGKYAGTWSHGAASGHLFGKIIKLQGDERPAEKGAAPQ